MSYRSRHLAQALLLPHYLILPCPPDLLQPPLLPPVPQPLQPSLPCPAVKPPIHPGGRTQPHSKPERRHLPASQPSRRQAATFRPAQGQKGKRKVLYIRDSIHRAVVGPKLENPTGSLILSVNAYASVRDERAPANKQHLNVNSVVRRELAKSNGDHSSPLLNLLMRRQRALNLLQLFTGIWQFLSPGLASSAARNCQKLVDSHSSSCG